MNGDDVCVVERALGLADEPAVAYLVQPMREGENPAYFPLCIEDARAAEDSIRARAGHTDQRIVSSLFPEMDR